MENPEIDQPLSSPPPQQKNNRFLLTTLTCIMIISLLIPVSIVLFRVIKPYASKVKNAGLIPPQKAITPASETNAQKVLEDTYIGYVIGDDYQIYGIDKAYKKEQISSSDAYQILPTSEKYYLDYNQVFNKTTLKDILGNTITKISGFAYPEGWFSNGSVLISIQNYSLYPSIVKNEIIDLKTGKVVSSKGLDKITTFNIDGVTNTGKIIYENNIIPIPTSGPNMELYVLDPSTGQEQNLGKFEAGGASSISALSSDGTKLAMSDTHNLFVYDFDKRTHTQLTHFSSTNRFVNTMQFMTWSPSNNYISFSSDTDSLGSSTVSILNIRTGKITTIEQSDVVKLLPYYNPGQKILVSVFSPKGWGNSDTTLFLRIEATVNEKVRVAYFAYDTSTTKLTYIPDLQDITYVNFTHVTNR